jgi:hypothetical protein
MTEEQKRNQEKWDEKMVEIYKLTVTYKVFSTIIEAKKLNPSDPKSKEFLSALIKRTEQNMADDEVWADKFRKTLRKLPSTK